MGVGGQGVQKWVRHVLSMAQYAPTPGPTGPSEATGAATGQPASLLPEFTPQTPQFYPFCLLTAPVSGV